MNPDYINFIKETIIRHFRLDLGTKHKYLIQDIIPFDYKSLTVYTTSKGFSDEKITELKSPDRFTHELDLDFRADALLIFEQKNTGIFYKTSKYFDTHVNCVFNPDTELFSFTFLDKNQLILNKYFDLIYNKYKELKIPSLVDDDFLINGKTSVELFTTVARKKQILSEDFFLFNNLGRISQDTRFYATHLIILKPYITDFLSDPTLIYGKKYFRYFPTVYDKQYLLSAGILFELFYNFWDQIGDVLAEVFLPALPKNKIYFATVIDQFPQAFKNSKNLQWFIDFKGKEYQGLNKMRKNIVHYNSIETDYFENYQDLFGNEAELKKLQLEKEELADYFLKQHTIAINGFEHLIHLMDEK
jgi:hypothetical protein